MGSERKGTNQYYGNKEALIDKGSFEAVKDSKNWIKPKKRRHKQGSTPITTNSPPFPKFPFKGSFSTEPKLTHNKDSIVLITPRDDHKRLMQHSPGRGTLTISGKSTMNYDHSKENIFNYLDDSKTLDLEQPTGAYGEN